MVGVVAHMKPHWLAETLRYVVAGLGTLTLLAAANSAMLGLSRLAYSLSTNRQIPSGLGRLHPKRSTPYVLIIIAGLIAAALVVPEDLDFLIGIYAFGAMLAFTIAHLSICRLRFTEPDRDRPYRVPFGIRVRGGSCRCPPSSVRLRPPPAGSRWWSCISPRGTSASAGCSSASRCTCSTGGR